jgi:hypothetical protein
LQLVVGTSLARAVKEFRRGKKSPPIFDARPALLLKVAVRKKVSRGKVDKSSHHQQPLLKVIPAGWQARVVQSACDPEESHNRPRAELGTSVQAALEKVCQCCEY